MVGDDQRARRRIKAGLRIQNLHAAAARSYSRGRQKSRRRAAHNNYASILPVGLRSLRIFTHACASSDPTLRPEFEAGKPQVKYFSSPVSFYRGDSILGAEAPLVS